MNCESDMNALLNFKRNTAKAPAHSLPDPLMESKVMLDEGETFSTLKFLDVKREQENTQARTAQINAGESKVTVDTHGQHRKNAAACVQTDTASTTVPVCKTQTAGSDTNPVESAKPTRLQHFRQRVLAERSEKNTLPFAANRPLAPLDFSIALVASQIQPVSSACEYPTVHVTTVTSDGDTPENRSHRYFLSRAADSTAALLQDCLESSSEHKALQLQLPARQGFDLCSGNAELFEGPSGAYCHRFVENDTHRIVRMAAWPRIALDSLTAGHTLRSRSCNEPAFSAWFSEDESDHDAGIHPIETFVQAELLHLNPHIHRTLSQLRKLSTHLQAHCPHLQPVAAVHDMAQADAWCVQHGQPVQPALYALLECGVSTSPTPETVHACLRGDAKRSLQLRDIQWPHIPESLLLLSALARIAASDRAERAAYEQLALLDVMLRKPDSALPQVTHPMNDWTDTRLAQLHQRLQTSFGTLGQVLHERGWL